MKLVKQSRLEYREGTSDKVYEVDLCELAPGSFTVNFRYGRRGTTLKEGSKTTRPVTRAVAEKEFDDLVASKTKKGYRVAGAPVTELPTRVVSTDGNARNQAVLDRLAAKSSGSKAKKWPIERAIWRAGELRIREAVPYLLRLVDAKNPMRTYCIAAALGLCGDTSAIPALVEIFKSPTSPDHVRRIAREALLRLADEPTRAEFRADTAALLVEPLRGAALGSSPDEFETAFASFIQSDPDAAAVALHTLYLVDTPTVRPAVLTTLRTAPFAPPWFRSLRHVFKASEYRRDAEVFGILAHRVEKERGRYRRAPYDAKRIVFFDVHGARHETRKEALLAPSPKTAFGQETKDYFRRRVSRTLRRLGEIGDPDYVRLAVGVLLPFSDSDAHGPTRTVYFRWVGNRPQNVETYWDAFAKYLAFNYVLYAESPRYELAPSGRAWRCKKTHRPGQPEPSAREEAFPDLWDAMPAGLLHLLSESECLPVHCFAAKALRARKEFCDQLDTEVIAMLLGRPYEVTARLGLDLAIARFDARNPDSALVLAVATCPLADARARALAWIDADRGRYASDADFVVALATSAHGDARTCARTLVLSAPYSKSAADALSRRLLSSLLELTISQSDVAEDLARTVFEGFGAQLRTLDLATVLDLTAHPLQAVQELGARILLNHDTPVTEMPGDVVARLVGSSNEAVRGLGIRLFGQIPEERLLADEAMIVAFVGSPLADVRAAARPLVRRLAASDGGLDVARRNFVTGLGERVVALFDEPEAGDGVFDDLAHVLVDDLEGWLGLATIESARRLVRGSSSAAQHVGGSVFLAHPEWAPSVATEELVTLGRMDIKSARDAAQALFSNVVGRFTHQAPDGQEQMLALGRVLDNRWYDARSFWFDAFRRTFVAKDLAPSVLVSICDSPREDVRALGRELITTHFKDDAGLEYLTKLSEHPSGDMRLFVTNFLERFASGQPSRLADLELYFVTVLSSVNAARTAKYRVLDFLRSEAAASEDAARVVAQILERLSATSAIGDRATAIEAMVDLRRAWPDVPLPIAIHAPQTRRGATA